MKRSWIAFETFLCKSGDPADPSESFPAVATAAPVCFVIGGVWFSPLLFGKARMGELRVTGEPSRSPGAILAIPASLAPSFRLGVILASAKVTELPPSLLVAVIVWACFTDAIELPGLVLERAPLKLAIGVDHKLLVYLGFAPVFALWT